MKPARDGVTATNTGASGTQASAEASSDASGQDGVRWHPYVGLVVQASTLLAVGFPAIGYLSRRVGLGLAGVQGATSIASKVAPLELLILGATYTLLSVVTFGLSTLASRFIPDFERGRPSTLAVPLCLLTAVLGVALFVPGVEMVVYLFGLLTVSLLLLWLLASKQVPRETSIRIVFGVSILLTTMWFAAAGVSPLRASEWTFDSDAGIDDGVYVEVGRSDGLLYLVPCEAPQSETLVVPDRFVNGERHFAFETENRDNPSAYELLVDHKPAQLGFVLQCPVGR